MVHTYDELHKKTAIELREIAKEIDHEELKGVATMHKEQLLPLLCKALGIDTHAHHHATAANKTAIKQKIRALKGKRDAAITEHNKELLGQIRGEIHDLKKELRKSMV